MKKVISTICVALCATAASAQVVSNTSFFVSEGAVVSIGQDFQNNGDFINEGAVHFQKDLINDGTINSQGNVILDGYAKQELKGTNAVVLANVALENDVELYNPLVVENEIRFNNGIVESSEKSPLVFAENANHTGASDVSHVVGSVRKLNADKFTFPLGDGSMFRAFEADGQKGNLTASYVAQNPFEVSSQFAKGVDYINEYEYWTLRSDNDKQEASVTIEGSDFATDGIAYLNKGSWKINDGQGFDKYKGLNQGILFTSGKGRNIQKSIGVWPNPTQGEFNLKLGGMDDNDEIMVDVTNADGRVVIRASGMVKDLRKVYGLPISLVTTELTVRVLNGDERLSEKLLLNR